MSPPIRLAKHVTQRSRVLVRVFWVNQYSGIPHHFRDPAAPGSHYCCAASHRLGIHQSERLLKQRWAREDRCSLEVARQFLVVVNVSRKLNATRMLTLQSKSLAPNLAHIRSLVVRSESGRPSNDQFRVRMVPEHLRKSPH